MVKYKFLFAKYGFVNFCILIISFTKCSVFTLFKISGLDIQGRKNKKLILFQCS